jgi:site-specific recombinase XerD
MLASHALEAFLLSYRGSKSPATITWYERRLKALIAFTGDVDITTITISRLRKWRVALCGRSVRYGEQTSGRAAEPGGLSAYTLHGYIRSARHWFKWLADEGLIEANPAERLELPRLPRGQVKGISQVDLVAIMEAAASSPRDLALVWFLYSTGCRVGGVANLRIGDLDVEHGRARVREKGNKSRTVFLLPDAVAAMRAWLNVRPDTDHEHVFLGKRGPLKTSGIYQILKRLAKSAGVAHGWNPHNWRHRRARDLLIAKVPLGVVAQILGHSDVATTSNIYGQLSDSDLQRAAQVPLPFEYQD